MKATKQPDSFTEQDYEAESSITPRMPNAFAKLRGWGFKLCDGEQEFWKNNGDTLVMAMPNDSRNGISPSEANAYTDELLQIGWAMRCDEFSIEPLEGVKGFNRIMRLWWD